MSCSIRRQGLSVQVAQKAAVAHRQALVKAGLDFRLLLVGNVAPGHRLAAEQAHARPLVAVAEVVAEAPVLHLVPAAAEGAAAGVVVPHQVGLEQCVDSMEVAPARAVPGQHRPGRVLADRDHRAHLACREDHAAALELEPDVLLVLARAGLRQAAKRGHSALLTAMVACHTGQGPQHLLPPPTDLTYLCRGGVRPTESPQRHPKTSCPASSCRACWAWCRPKTPLCRQPMTG
ncbi:MAG: hypothetical protein GX358_12665 [candidate division WS1 bacterium]|nr:hypothetical protein [candidate division WS1 bacterium]